MRRSDEQATGNSARRDELAANLADVEARLAKACAAAGRARDEVTLVAVTKTFPASDVRLLAALGVLDVAENRDQEARRKAAECAQDAMDLRWHFVGQLQRNKARSVVRYADVVHSVDRLDLIEALAEEAAKRRDTPLDVLIQVSLDTPDAPEPDAASVPFVTSVTSITSVTPDAAPAGPACGSGGPSPTTSAPQAPAVTPAPVTDGSQGDAEIARAGAGPISPRGGVAPADVLPLAAAVAGKPALQLRGVMAVAPRGSDPDEAFARLAKVSGELRRAYPRALWISAGMSGDLESAIRHGATHVRVGSALLGNRWRPHGTVAG